MVASIPDPAGHPVEHAVDLLHAVNRAIRKAAVAAQPEGAPSPAEARALRVLGNSAGGMRMSELADALRIARRSTTSVVDALTAAGLVVRSPDPEDGRAVVVELTAAGRDELRRASRRRAEAGAAVLSRLTEQELTTLTALLSRLV